LVLSIKPFTAGDGESSAVAALRGYLDAIVAAGLLALLLTVFVVRIFYISSISMIPTLEVGDVFLIDQLAYRLHGPRDDDIAIFSPPIAGAREDFIKRVIGAPGDTLRVTDGIVYRNGKPLSEPYENQPPKYDLQIRNYGIYVDGVALDPAQAHIPARGMWQKPDRIPDGYYFMLGDNRNYSDDSHVWGFVPRTSFGGRAFLIMWPLTRFAILQS
jgi:signal peptidase I